ncbi:hypothetical protein GUJ93_ZPchr0003g18480 [Zizania palustris]|uniref:Uncharacterized protein n=1 Tax=Zizania palustris TaxID=103762 RepID=A0A8J5SHJ5_ZIZPA|nr:hypothetical protein GUJ93_ZPchr0003g18480 [Zizania palustris]
MPKRRPASYNGATTSSLCLEPCARNGGFAKDRVFGNFTITSLDTFSLQRFYPPPPPHGAVALPTPVGLLVLPAAASARRHHPRLGCRLLLLGSARPQHLCECHADVVLLAISILLQSRPEEARWLEAGGDGDVASSRNTSLYRIELYTASERSNIFYGSA